MNDHVTAVPGAVRNRRKPYPEYNDSGIEWLGEVPKHWQVRRLKLLSTLSGRIGFHGLSSSDYGSDGIILVSGVDFRNWHVDWNRCNRIPEEWYEKDKNIQLRNGDLLVTKDGTIGKTAVVRGLQERAVLNAGVIVVRPQRPDSYDTRFMLYVINSMVFTEFINIKRTGATVHHLYEATFNDFVIPLPSLTEQAAIADFLDSETAKIEALIAKKERLIELLEEKRTALISHTVTKGLDPNVPIKQSGIEWLGEIPAHWEVKRLKHLVSFRGGGTPSKDIAEYWQGDTPWVSPKDMKSETIDDTEDHITAEAISDSATRVIEAGAVLLVVRSGILRHAIPVATNTCSVAVNQDMKALIPGPELTSEYLKYFIAGQQAPLLVEWRKQGATVESIEHAFLANSLMPVPPLLEQEAVTAVLDREAAKIDALVGKVSQALHRLTEYRTAVISAAVTGKIDVREAVS